MSGVSSIASSVNQLKRKASTDISPEAVKKARLDELATLAALSALASESAAEEPTEEQQLDKLEKFPDHYLSLPFEMKESVLFNKLACSKNGLCLQYMDTFYRNKPEIVLAAIQNNPRAINFMGPYVHKGIDIVIDVLKKDPSLISLVPAQFFERSTDLLQLLSLTGIEGFKKAPEKAKKDPELLLTLIKSGYKDLLEDLHDELKSSGEFFRAILMDHDLDLSLLEHAKPSYTDDQDFMLSIIDLSDDIVKRISDRLKKDKNFILKALELTDVSAFVTEDMLSDHKMLEALIKFKPEMYLSLPEDVQNDPSFAISMLIKNPLVLDKLPNSLKQELKQKDFVLEFFRELKDSLSEDDKYQEPQVQSALEVLGKRWFSQVDFMMQVIEIDPSNIIYATTAIKKNKEVIKKIAELSAEHLHLVDQGALEAPKFMKELVIINPDSIDYLPLKIWEDHKLLKELLKVHPDLLYKFPDELRELKIFR